jgi:hypothetical protein
MFVENILHVIVDVRRITILILQLHLDFAPELIILREHGYHRNLNNPSRQPRFIKPCLDVPFLSEQILLMCFISSDGWSLSVGMQYLKNKLCEYGTVNTQKNKPYRVQSIIQWLVLRPTTNKPLHNLQLPVISGLESAGVVENITFMTRKGEFELDIMLATLRK